MAIGEFGGAPTAPAEGAFVLSSPMYWLYELSHAALNPSRALADATRLFYKNPINPLAHTTFGKSMAAGAELFERSTRRYSQPEWGIDSTLVGAERVPITIVPVWQRPFCRLLHFSRAFRARAAPAAAEAFDRCADVGPLRDAVARHGRGVPAQSRRLHHRMGRRAHRSAVERPFRSRRLHRLRHFDSAFPRRRHPCRRGVPAVGAGDRRGGGDGGRRRSLRAEFDDADGRADRYARQSDRGQQARRKSRRRLVPPQCHHQGAVSALRASCATSIRVSCSSTALSA